MYSRLMKPLFSMRKREKESSETPGMYGLCLWNGVLQNILIQSTEVKSTTMENASPIPPAGPLPEESRVHFTKKTLSWIENFTVDKNRFPLLENTVKW